MRFGWLSSLAHCACSLWAVLAVAHPPEAAVAAHAEGWSSGAAQPCPTVAAGNAADERIDGPQALALVRHQACDEVYEDNAHAHHQCLSWLYSLQVDSAAAEPKPTGEARNACSQLDYLRARLPACVNALAMYLEAMRDSDDALQQQAIAYGADACDPNALCMGTQPDP